MPTNYVYWIRILGLPTNQIGTQLILDVLYGKRTLEECSADDLEEMRAAYNSSRNDTSRSPLKPEHLLDESERDYNFRYVQNIINFLKELSNTN